MTTYLTAVLHQNRGRNIPTLPYLFKFLCHPRQTSLA